MLGVDETYYFVLLDTNFSFEYGIATVTVGFFLLLSRRLFSQS